MLTGSQLPLQAYSFLGVLCAMIFPYIPPDQISAVLYEAPSASLIVKKFTPDSISLIPNQEPTSRAFQRVHQTCSFLINASS